MTSAKSKRAARRELVAKLRAGGMTFAEIGAVLQKRWPEMSALAALRAAHGWSLQDAAREWAKLWPDQPRHAPTFGKWENWATGSGRCPSLATLDQLARLYQCAVVDLITDAPDHRHLDPASTTSPAGTGPGHSKPPVPALAPATLVDADPPTIGTLIEAIGVAVGDAGHPAVAELCFRLALWAEQADRRGEGPAAQNDPEFTRRVERLRSQAERSAQLSAREGLEPGGAADNRRS